MSTTTGKCTFYGNFSCPGHVIDTYGALQATGVMTSPASAVYLVGAPWGRDQYNCIVTVDLTKKGFPMQKGPVMTDAREYRATPIFLGK